MGHMVLGSAGNGASTSGVTIGSHFSRASALSMLPVAFAIKKSARVRCTRGN